MDFTARPRVDQGYRCARSPGTRCSSVPMLPPNKTSAGRTPSAVSLSAIPRVSGWHKVLSALEFWGTQQLRLPLEDGPSGAGVIDHYVSHFCEVLCARPITL